MVFRRILNVGCESRRRGAFWYDSHETEAGLYEYILSSHSLSDLGTGEDVGFEISQKHTS